MLGWIKKLFSKKVAHAKIVEPKAIKLQSAEMTNLYTTINNFKTEVSKLNEVSRQVNVAYSRK